MFNYQTLTYNLPTAYDDVDTTDILTPTFTYTNIDYSTGNVAFDFV